MDIRDQATGAPIDSADDMSAENHVLSDPDYDPKFDSTSTHEGETFLRMVLEDDLQCTEDFESFGIPCPSGGETCVMD